MKGRGMDRKQFLCRLSSAVLTAVVYPADLGGAVLTAESELKITPLSPNGTALKTAFNEASAKPRLLGIFSPTCANCLKVCSDIQDMLSNYPDEDLEVLILWAPYGERDNVGLAIQAADAYLPDSRVRHFWDMWRFGSRAYSPKLRIPETQAWDLILFYDSDVLWEEPVPRYSSWMQNRHLRTGAPYSRKGFENRFKEWLQ